MHKKRWDKNLLIRPSEPTINGLVIKSVLIARLNYSGNRPFMAVNGWSC